MSLLRIQHRTVYRYSRPVEFGRHRLVMRPREGHDLRILSMSLAVEPLHSLLWTRDVFGNSVAFIEPRESAATLSIASDVVVERFPPFPDALDSKLPPTPYPVGYDAMEMPIATVYQLPSFPEEAETLQPWLDQLLPAQQRADANQMLMALCTGVKQRINYRRREERGVQTPARTIELGSGSCRDMATLLMECARLLKIASRFVSGYLHCPASIAGRASTHAWMEAYFPAVGWRGFDPTLGEYTSLKHVSVGVSHHPRGVMPISGTFTGGAGAYQEMQVQVSTEELKAEDVEVSREHPPSGDEG